MEELRKIDVKKMDEQLERHLYRVCALNQGTECPKAVFATSREYRQIDARKLAFKKQLRKGTSTIVYKSFLDGQEVAVKVFDGRVDNRMIETQKAYCYKEAVSIWHNLSHPNVTKFVGTGKNSKLMIPSKDERKPKKASFVVAEYVSGGSLKSCLINMHKWKLSFKIFIRLAFDLTKGQCYLHSKSIAHKDMKTKNMLINEKMLTLKLADFGVACMEPPYPSQMSGFIGTLGYMAPEFWEMYCSDMPFLNPKFVSDITQPLPIRPRIPR